jgi:hypothetical protein
MKAIVLFFVFWSRIHFDRIALTVKGMKNRRMFRNLIDAPTSAFKMSVVYHYGTVKENQQFTDCK